MAPTIESLILATLSSEVSTPFPIESSSEDNVGSIISDLSEAPELGIFGSGSGSGVGEIEIFPEKVSFEDHSGRGGFGNTVSKYFQVLFALFLGMLLLTCTLSIIRQTKKFFRQRRKSVRKIPLLAVDNGGNVASECGGIKSCMAQEKDQARKKNNVEKGGPAGARHFDCYKSGGPPLPLGNSNDAPHQEDKDKLAVPCKKVRFVRRISGPFAEDAIAFARQTYKNRGKEVESPEHLGLVPALIKSHSIKKQSHHHSSKDEP